MKAFLVLLKFIQGMWIFRLYIVTLLENRKVSEIIYYQTVFLYSGKFV